MHIEDVKALLHPLLNNNVGDARNPSTKGVWVLINGLVLLITLQDSLHVLLPLDSQRVS